MGCIIGSLAGTVSVCFDSAPHKSLARPGVKTEEGFHVVASVVIGGTKRTKQLLFDEWRQ